MRTAFIVFSAGLVLLALVVGNVPSAADEPQEKWGTIKGQVVWGEKELPTAEKLDITKDKDVCLKNGPVVSEEYIVDPKTKGVKNVFVFLGSAKAPKKPTDKWDKIPVHPSLAKSKEKTVTLDQPCCSFVPHCLAMRSDQTLEIKNSAAVSHNTHLIGKNDYGYNKILPPSTSQTEQVASNAGQINVQCDIHPWMKGYIWMFEHPYFMLTGADGKFEIKNVPAGDYRIVIWQEGMGWVAFDGPDAAGRQGKLITIKADGDTDLGTFKVMLPKKD